MPRRHRAKPRPNRRPQHGKDLKRPRAWHRNRSSREARIAVEQLARLGKAEGRAA